MENQTVVKKERYQTRAAQAAKQIREILKKEFPGIKFRVRSDNFSMGDSVDVKWDNGPTYDQVEKFIIHYEYGRFDGMTDCYEYTNCREDIPQTKYLHCSRDVSQEIYDQAFEYFRETFQGGKDIKTMDEYSPKYNGSIRQWLYRYIVKLDLRKPFNKEVFHNLVMSN